jgi:hypothetical protein
LAGEIGSVFETISTCKGFVGEVLVLDAESDNNGLMGDLLDLLALERLSDSRFFTGESLEEVESDSICVTVDLLVLTANSGN